MAGWLICQDLWGMGYLKILLKSYELFQHYEAISHFQFYSEMGKHCSATLDLLKTIVFALQAEIHRDQRMWACRGPQERSRTLRECR